MRSYSILFYLILLSLPLRIYSQQFSVGYRELRSTDSSRLYKPNALIDDPLMNRPLELDIWYPAVATGNASPLSYSYFLRLFERRANSFQNNTRYDGIASELEKHFAAGNPDGQTTSVPLTTCLNTPPATGRFPIIIYLCAMNGMSYENVHLFELLAANGYIVVSISSVGRYPGNMTTDPADIEEQVIDARLAIQIVRTRFSSDSAGTGLLGYSLGSLAAQNLAHNNASVKAILSLDGSDLHYYGVNKHDDDHFNEWRSRIRPVASSPHYAYLSADERESRADSSFPAVMSSDSHHNYLRLYKTTHEDFSTISFFQSKENHARYTKICQLTLAFFEQYLQEKGTPFTEQIALTLNRKEGADRLDLSVKPRHIAQMLSGSIMSAPTGQAIPYASIQSAGTDRGTVANAKGEFQFDISGLRDHDSIVVSSLGFITRQIDVRQFRESLLAGTAVWMERKTQALREVVIIAKSRISKIKGNTSQSRFMSVGFPLKALGSEVGIRIHLGRQKVLLKSFNYAVSHLRVDSAVFRLNIYSWENGKPGPNVLKQNILTRFDSTGTYSINLLPYKIIASGTVLVSLEWIDGHASAGEGNVFFSAGLLSSSYRRNTTSSKWIRSGGLGTGFNISVLKQ